MGLKFSKRPLLDALAAVREVAQTWAALDGEKAALNAPDLVLDGQRAVDAFRARLAEIDAAKAEAAASALAAVHEARDEWEREVRDALTPQGADLTDPDFKLMEISLIQTPDELRRVLDRHADSVAFSRMAERYADERNWSGFTALDESAAVESFATDVFQRLEIAAQAPSGFWALVFSEPGALDNMATAAGVAGQWQTADE